jgi:hypothetical protein
MDFGDLAYGSLEDIIYSALISKVRRDVVILGAPLMNNVCSMRTVCEDIRIDNAT